MGNNQSEENTSRQQANMSVSEVERILDTQRRRFEQKLRQELAKQSAQQRQEKEAQERRAREQATLQAGQSTRPPAAATSNAVQQQAVVTAPMQPLYPNLQTPNYPHPNQPQPFNQTNPFRHQPNPTFQNYPQGHPLNPPQPWTPAQHINPHYPMNQPNQNRATPTPPPQDFVVVNAPEQRYRPAPSAPSAPTEPPCITARPRTPNAISHGPRSRSTSRPRPVNKKRGICDCPTCYQRYGLKIFQCPNGHSSCNDCKMRGRACGICGMPLTEVRNFEIESYVAQTPAPCPNKNEGCYSMIKQIDMEKHLEDCPYREQQCPLTAIFGTCHWKGKLSQMSTHFDEMHSPNRGIDAEKEIYLKNIHDSSRQVHLVVVGGHNFLCHLKVSEPDGKIFMSVQLLGNKTSAKKWSYEIHIYKKSEPRRKYMYTDTCVYANRDIEDVFKSCSCAVLPIFYAASFTDKEGLAFKFFINENLNLNKNDEVGSQEQNDETNENDDENMNRNDAEKSQRPHEVENWRGSRNATEYNVDNNQEHRPHYQRPRLWVNQTPRQSNTGHRRHSVEVENWRSSASGAQRAGTKAQWPNKRT
ncbi:hypothetical protein SFRURICE_009287 [Spodoptera frugiperda]|nr:hypothetical protein SFRURICE_009287 [Spodoptera frugiperda]